MTTLTVQARDRKHLSKIKTALKLVDADFKEEKTSYNPEFVKRIEKSRENYKNGEYIVMTEAYKKELFGSL